MMLTVKVITGSQSVSESWLFCACEIIQLCIDSSMTSTLFVLGGCCLKLRKKTWMITLLNMMVSGFDVHFHYIVSDVLVL